jgi:hypothetical protein
MREIHLTAISPAAAHAYKPGECNCVLRDFFFFCFFSFVPVLVVPALGTTTRNLRFLRAYGNYATSLYFSLSLSRAVSDR